jgi:hypothetical protein
MSSHFLDLVFNALLKSFWRKRALITFLRRHRVSENYIASWDESESKRDFLERLFPALEKHPQADNILQKIAESLSEQINFPDLEGWEESEQKIRDATESVAALKRFMARAGHNAEELRRQASHKKTVRERDREVLRARQTLQTLQMQLSDLTPKLGTQEGGYQFQNWFYDLVDFCEITCRPFVATGRQIDGSITVDGTTYLIELKFTEHQAAATDIDSLTNKVRDKADNTMGIMLSMSGYSSTARQQASGRGSPVLLLDSSHVFLILGGVWSLVEVINRSRRHASQTGDAYLSAQDF